MAKKHPEQPAAQEFKVNPFAGLKVEGLAAPAPAAPAAKPAPAGAGAAAPRGPGGLEPFSDRKLAADLLRNAQEKRKPVIHLRMERKGRGGKTVTVLRGFPDESLSGLMDVLGRMKRDLGTGGTVQETVLELQGDQRERAAAWLQRNGFEPKPGN